MERLSEARVTPDGVRDGDPTILAAMCARRGPSVLGYCREVSAPGHALEAASQAMADFRTAVARAEDPWALEPEPLLLSLTRQAAAAHAPPPPPATGTWRLLTARSRQRTCELVPELLVARAEHRLGPADTERLERHLQRCHNCAAEARRFHAAERAYRDPPEEPLDQLEADRLLEALVAAVPVQHGAEATPPAMSPDGSEWPNGSESPDPSPTLADESQPAPEPAAAEWPPPHPEPVSRDLSPPGPEPSHDPGPEPSHDPHVLAPEPPAELGTDGLPLGPPGAMDARDLRPEEHPLGDAEEIHHDHEQDHDHGDEIPRELPPLPPVSGLQVHRAPWGWRLALPAIVVAVALGAALVIAGVFSSGSSHSPKALRPMPPATTSPTTGLSSATTRRRAHHARRHHRAPTSRGSTTSGIRTHRHRRSAATPATPAPHRSTHRRSRPSAAY